MRHFWEEVIRVRWMLLVALLMLAVRTRGIVPDTSVVVLLLHKPALAAIGFIAAHIGYQQAFPYLDQRMLLQKALQGDEQAIGAQLFMGTCLLRGLIYGAFILGVSLGL